MKKNTEDSLYISSGFEESTLIYIFKFINSFSDKKKINKIYFEDKLTLKYYLKYSKKLNLVNNNLFLKEHFMPPWYSHFIPKIIIIFLINIKNIIFLVKNSNKKNFKKKKFNWKYFQILHSFWDKNNYEIKEDELSLSFIDYLKNLFNIINAITISNKILKKKNIKYIFLSHPVYQYRVFLSLLRDHKIIYLLGVFGLYKLHNRTSDNDWNFVQKKLINYLVKNKKFVKDSNVYWKKRDSGKSNYIGARIASKGSKLSINKKKINTNYIFLHIFRDSPFRVIDKKRIFVDYFEWFKKTIEIINLSDENWVIRLHPSHKLWGENQLKIVRKLLANYSKKNIIIDDKFVSNINIFKFASKIVTFSGTSATEAIGYGIKPIIISTTSCHNLMKQSSHRVKSLNHYKKLLLDKNPLNFKVSKENSSLAKKLIYIQENLLRFDKDIGSIEIYRNTDNFLRKKNIFNTLKKINRTSVIENNILNIDKYKTTLSEKFFKNY